MNYGNRFEFFHPGKLVNGGLELILVEKRPAAPAKGIVPAYIFEMKRVGTNIHIGGISLRVGDNENIDMYAGHIGYGVNQEYRGNRYAARSCQLILPLAKRHGINPIWITCNPDNIASRRTCEIVGAKFVEIVEVPEKFYFLYKKADRLKCRYHIDL